MLSKILKDFFLANNIRSLLKIVSSVGLSSEL